MNSKTKSASDEKMSTTESRSSRQEARREELLRVATDIFFRSGFAGASLDEVIARAGGSKRTMYSYFGNKEQLFATIVREISHTAMAPLRQNDFCHADLETTLYDVGRRYIDVIMSSEALQLYRIVVAEGSRFPQLARVFFDTGPGQASANLARTLEQMRENWGIQEKDTTRLAEHFLGMIRDDLHLQVVLGLRAPPSPGEAAIAVRTAVDIFMHGIRLSAWHSLPGHEQN
ncbi:TetR/AcrR family transcriptional regulator C-terminal domain-containing protein [Labrys sp. ZIDIC5]|uniref:TetR/AcrR family transcriptional regulator C-terminal domain-containing protein n=1 Tax=Labrys sedimenti TaxID=3106036 RepID=UPI002ACABC11|nr:TetR/AcrR family transcriptional regulator C-terminal domain-containing protein [Labrys sp. ZIDIC5]MDZ5454429.1 TetR/AcrR family transcriptional regulator C-terminal domain-containing protein [Labrys sp. ZIDIC5]